MRTLQRGSKGEDVKTLQRMLHLYDDGIFGKLTEEKVMEFQSANSLKPDGVVGPKTWEKLLPIGDELKKSRRLIKEIIVHCTATKEGVPVTIEEIRKWHKKNGWSDIGYHYVVTLDGKIKGGRDVNISGAHCSGHNSYSIGVCYVGGLDKNGITKDTRTKEQKKSLENLLVRLLEMYPEAEIHGHNEYAKKACPCFNAHYEYSALRNAQLKKKEQRIKDKG